MVLKPKKLKPKHNNKTNKNTQHNLRNKNTQPNKSISYFLKHLFSIIWQVKYFSTYQ